MQNKTTALALSQSLEVVPALLAPYSGESHLVDDIVCQSRICSVVHLMSQKAETSTKLIEGHAAFGIVRLLEMVEAKTKTYILHSIYNVLRLTEVIRI